MEDKEERILIARSTDYTLTDTDKGELFEGKIEPYCANVMTRQEAIEVMAKEIYKRRWIESECKDKNTLGFSICKDYAEIALNALLGVEK